VVGGGLNTIPPNDPRSTTEVVRQRRAETFLMVAASARATVGRLRQRVALRGDHPTRPVDAPGRMPIISLIFLIPAIYVACRTFWPLSLPLWSRVLVALLLLAASQYHLWSRLSSGSVFAPEFPRAAVVLFNWALGALLLLWFVQIVLDLGLVTAAVVQWRRVGLPDTARYGAIALALLVSALAVAQAIRVPPIKDVEVEIAGLAPPFEGYRILQLTDLHVSRLFPDKWARAVVTRANAAGADTIVVTGDFIDGSVDMRRDDVAPLRALRAADGVWAIPGNHEYFFDYGAWMRHLTALGFRMLPNAHIVIRRDGAALVVAGVTDLSAPSVGEAPPDLGVALRGAPAGVPIILLDHQPRQARQAAARGVALQLSGHTHGGMVIGLDRLVARANAGFVAGRYAVGGMTLYVSNGTGLWPGFALRLGVPSEMTRFTLRAKP
jgi:uncharacterized protein